MDKMTAWHEDDAFWTEMAPFMFTEERWAGTAQEVDAIEALLHLAPPAAVLDLGCGPGRHVLEFARRGYAATGVDRTAAYLEEARRRAAAEELPISFVEADLRRFSAPPAFDIALNLFTAFGYFEEPAENLAVLRTAQAALRPGGRFVLEMMGKEVLARIFQPRDWSEPEEGLIILEERSVARDWSMSSSRWIKLEGTQRREFRFTHWVYSAAELRVLLHEAGFAEVAFYGDVGGRPYDHEATRLVAVAQKAGSGGDD